MLYKINYGAWSSAYTKARIMDKSSTTIDQYPNDRTYYRIMNVTEYQYYADIRSTIHQRMI